MKLSVPTNWQPQLIDRLSKVSVGELYGKLDKDIVGGGRPALILSSVTKQRVKEHVALIHRNGLKFNYLLNALCMGNREWTARGQRDIRVFLDWLAEIGVDTITVAMPYVLQLIKKSYPLFRVKVSVCAGVDSAIQAKYWEELGADEISLSPWSVNRNFRLLKQIRNAVNCDLQLYANTRCLTGCPFMVYHYLGANHASNSLGGKGGFLINYCEFMCNYLILLEPWRLISSCWIRPEDLHFYRKWGVNSIKLSERNAKTEFLSRTIEAYSQEKFEGNLMDLFIDGTKRLSSGKRFLWKKFLFFCRPAKVNILRLYGYLKNMPSSLPIFLDNSKLDNFLNFFVEGKCDHSDCGRCGYCRGIAEKAVNLPENDREELLRTHKEMLDSLFDGSMFDYGTGSRKKRCPL